MMLTPSLKPTYFLTKVRRSFQVIRRQRSRCSNVHKFWVRRGRSQASCKSEPHVAGIHQPDFPL